MRSSGKAVATTIGSLKTRRREGGVGGRPTWSLVTRAAGSPISGRRLSRVEVRSRETVGVVEVESHLPRPALAVQSHV